MQPRGRHNLISGGIAWIRNQNPACTDESAPGGKDQSVRAAFFSPAEQRSHCHPGSYARTSVRGTGLCSLSSLQFRTIGNKPRFQEPVPPENSVRRSFPWVFDLKKETQALRTRTLDWNLAFEKAQGSEALAVPSLHGVRLDDLSFPKTSSGWIGSIRS